MPTHSAMDLVMAHVADSNLPSESVGAITSALAANSRLEGALRWALAWIEATGEVPAYIEERDDWDEFQAARNAVGLGPWR